MYRLLKKQGNARRGEFQTVHGTVQTPAFMNVATAAAIKGGLSALDLKENHCQVMLCNTYHLHLRPGDQTVAKLGWPDPDRQRRVPSIQPFQASQNHRRGRYFCISS